ncbi:LytR C-terminal domain-containing protein [Amycolatopsis alkalitolerans]|uniref:LytR family transcriptional regulator n=1 Tax=Amycolatopsis alkalitolerans TaxID=2547244 RepID=A0A5C4M5L5_9PSEU|nr:LytR C-terminal domain-containing protein [Amycolatopsis alkalitolerans]TNC28095.1 LytR family transcriptional regulator [Amycolatopsis alkalitolerans]
MNFFQGLSRPMRLAGVVLLVIAAGAAIVGIVTAVSGGGPSNTAQPSSSAAPPPSGPGGSAAPPTASSAAPPTTTTAGPPPATSQPASPPGASATQPAPPNGGVPVGQAEAKWVPVRVYNNSTIKGLAARAADDLRAGGWNVAEVSNYPYGIIPTTTAYYTPGTDEETAARAIAAAYNMQAAPRFEGIQNASPGVIVIVTNDYQGLHAKGS